MTKLKAFLAIAAALILVSSINGERGSHQEHRAGARRLGGRIGMEARL